MAAAGSTRRSARTPAPAYSAIWSGVAAAGAGRHRVRRGRARRECLVPEHAMLRVRPADREDVGQDGRPRRRAAAPRSRDGGRPPPPRGRRCRRRPRRAPASRAAVAAAAVGDATRGDDRDPEPGDLARAAPARAARPSTWPPASIPCTITRSAPASTRSARGLCRPRLDQYLRARLVGARDQFAAGLPRRTRSPAHAPRRAPRGAPPAGTRARG